MRVGIVGLGFVGKALLHGLTEHVEVMEIDPRLGTSIANLKDFNPEIIFICVPTPMTDDGKQDISVVNSVINEINLHNISSLIVLKSTVLPNYIKTIEASVKKFIFNPEFLREKYANEDFINSTLIVFGGDPIDAEELANFYDVYTKCICKEYVYIDSTSASFIKYSINSFLATKVTFFNHLHEIFESSSSDGSWKNLVNAIARDTRIGPTHLDVPGHDGRKGYGGACFPKDTNAFNNYSNKINKPFTLLKKSIDINNEIRSIYNDATDREKEQNINFNKQEK